jgi:hypothetical protein
MPLMRSLNARRVENVSVIAGVPNEEIMREGHHG